MSPILGSNPGSNPFFSRTGELFFALPLEKRIPAPRSGALENFRPQNRVFTPHFLSKITSIRVVYGVNRNLLIEIQCFPFPGIRVVLTTFLIVLESGMVNWYLRIPLSSLIF